MTAPADRPERWPVEASDTVFSGAVVSVRTDTVRSPVDGARFSRDVVVHPGAVAILALDDDDRVLLVSQYRHPVGARLTEIPAGLCDVAGEPLVDAAARELYEEGHVRAGEWRVLADTYSSPGMTDETIRIFLARDITEVAPEERHEGEHEEADMDLRWVPLADVVAAVLAGTVGNATLSVAALAAWAVRHGAGPNSLRPADAPAPRERSVQS